METRTTICTKPQTRLSDSVSSASILSPSSKSSLSKKSLTRTTISENKSEEISTEMCEEDLDEDCEKKSVANFQKNYLELGQWPEVPVPVFQAFKTKYRGMKQKLKDCRVEKEKVERQLKRYHKGEMPCGKCSELREKNTKSKAALEQAVQLSNMLLKELKRMESRDCSVYE